MKSVTALLTLRNSLRTNLTDPYTYAGGSARSGSTWVFYDEPTGVKYPMVEIIKIDNPTAVISIGGTQNPYWEQEFVIANVYVKVKNGFKATIGGIEYTNAQLVEYYLGEIKETLKGQFNTLWNNGVKGYKHIKTTKIEYDECNQLYFAAVTVVVMYFNQ